MRAIKKTGLLSFFIVGAIAAQAGATSPAVEKYNPPSVSIYKPSKTLNLAVGGRDRLLRAIKPGFGGLEKVFALVPLGNGTGKKCPLAYRSTLPSANHLEMVDLHETFIPLGEI